MGKRIALYLCLKKRFLEASKFIIEEKNTVMMDTYFSRTIRRKKFSGVLSGNKYENKSFP